MGDSLKSSEIPCIIKVIERYIPKDEKGETAMERRILCFGDSNTWGFNAVTRERFENEVRWTKRLGKILGEDFEIIEEGLNGRCAVNEDQLKEGLKGLDYIHPCIMSHKPLDLVIIMLGTNDAKERYGMTPHNMAMGIIRVANKVRHSETGRGGQDPEILLVAPAAIGAEYVSCDAFLSMGREADRKTREMAAHLEMLSKESGFHYLNAGDHLEMGETDYMHLDEKGHRIMARILSEKITGILSEEGVI